MQISPKNNYKINKKNGMILHPWPQGSQCSPVYICHKALEALCQLILSRTKLIRKEDKGKVEDVQRFLKDMGVRESLRSEMVAVLAKSSKISRRIFKNHANYVKKSIPNWKFKHL